MTRHRFAGEPFDDADDAIASALEDMSIPALMCSLVHMTGDPSWVRGEIQPRPGGILDIQCGMPEEEPRPGAPARPPGDRRLPRRGLRPRRALPGAPGGDDGVPRSPDRSRAASPGCSSTTCNSRAATRVPSPGVRSSPPTRGQRRPSSSSDAGWAGYSPASACSRPDCPSRSSRRTGGRAGRGGRTATPGHASTSAAISTASPSNLPTTGASSTASTPSCAPTSARSPRSTACLEHCRFDTAVTNRTWDEDQSVWHVHVPRHERRGRGARSPLRHQRGGLAQPAPRARHPGHGHLRRAVVPLGPLARGPRHRREPRSPSSVPAPAVSRSAPPSPSEVAQLTIFQRTAQWIIPNPLYHAPVPPGDELGTPPPAFLRAVVPLHHDLRRHRGRQRSLPHRSRLGGPDPPVGQRDARQASCVPAGVDAVPGGRASRARRQGRAGLPGHGQARAAGRRHLAALPPAAQCRARAHRRSRGSSPTVS